MNDVTRILSEIEAGDPAAAEQLLPLVYEELRKLAAAKLRQEKPGQTLQATALVHEAYMRLLDVEKAKNWDSRGHFFSAAAEAMRRILIEHARKRRRRQAIQGRQVLLDNLVLAMPMPSDSLLSLDGALRALESHDRVAAEIVKLRFFAGLTMAQTADVLGISLRTAERNWQYARTWLHRELEEPRASRQ
jgi:RNA polymerase sigma factor (TIGR02999 family)